ncbi:MAG: TPM domain-containing protein [Alphaproteobacteria bacterium]
MMKLTQADKTRIMIAVKAAEARTGAEFSVTVARAADPYAAFPLLWAVMLALVGGGALVMARPDTPSGLMFGAIVALLVLLALALGFAPLRHRLAPARVKREHANRLALAQFAEHVQGRTHGKVGVLLFVALAEHHAQVLVERGIADAVPQGQWQAIIDRLTADIAAGKLGEGVEAALDGAATLLAPHFPPVAGDRNELPDHVREV